MENFYRSRKGVIPAGMIFFFFFLPHITIFISSCFLYVDFFPLAALFLILSLQGKLEEAENFFLSALQEAKEGFGAKDPHVASSCNNLVGIRSFQ